MKQNENSIAMFDRIKGLGMLMIIFFHTVSVGALYHVACKNIFLKVLFVFCTGIGNVLIPLFFIISGYGFRKMPVKNCIKNQLRFIMKPYLVIAFFAGTVHLCCHYGAFHYWPGAVKETLKVLGGFAFALPSNQTFMGIPLFFCGAAWYLIALMIGWIVLDIIEALVNEKFVKWAVLIVVAIGWLSGLYKGMYFCISQGFIASGLIYLGQMIKKLQYLKKDYSVKEALVLIAGLILSAVSMLWTGTIDNMADGVWALGIFSILLDGILGTMLLRYLLLINQTVLYPLGVIGKYSLIVLGVHAVEMTAIPWYLFPRIWENRVITDLTQYVIRLTLILVVSWIVYMIQNAWKNLRYK